MAPLLAALADLVLPTDCAGCRAPGWSRACPACTAALGGPARPVEGHASGVAVHAVVAFDGPARAILLAHKERGRLALAGPLGVALAAGVRAVAAGAPAVLVPVPSRWSARRRRGHDPTRRIAAAAATRLRAGGHTVSVARALTHRRGVADQSGLDARARAANIGGALAVRRGARATVAGRRVIVVDDICTTGATIAEAARALREAGAVILGAAVVAATLRRSGDSPGPGAVSAPCVPLPDVPATD